MTGGALEGIRVLDLSIGWAGPSASMYLADQGADVVKVEPLEGDLARGWGPSPVLPGTSRSFIAINRNKRGIALDLLHPEGQAVLRRLVAHADVAVSNALPSAGAKRGIDSEAVSAVNPRLVYGLVTGYGTDGVLAEAPAYDQIIQGVTGAMARRLPDGTPLRAGVLVADTSAPMLLAYGITLGLFERERTGRGQLVTTTLVQAAVALQSVDLVDLERDAEVVEPSTTASTLYACLDGRFINVIALTERQIVALFAALGLETLIEEAFAAGTDVTTLQRGWHAELSDAFLARPSEEWLTLLRSTGVPAGPVRTRREALEAVDLHEAGVFQLLDSPHAGRVTIAGVPILLASTPRVASQPAPSLGEHTDEVLTELGYAAEAVARLRELHIVA